MIKVLEKVAAKTSKDGDVLVKFVSKGSGLSYYLGKKGSLRST
jgi:hypothetical protein